MLGWLIAALLVAWPMIFERAPKPAWRTGEIYNARVTVESVNAMWPFSGGSGPGGCFTGRVHGEHGRNDSVYSPVPLYLDDVVRCKVFHVRDPSIVIRWRENTTACWGRSSAAEK